MCDPVVHFRDKLAFTQSRAASYFFDGSSYAVVRDITRRGKFGQVTRFDIEVRTPADNGLVLLMVNGVSTNGRSSLFPFIYFLCSLILIFLGTAPTHTQGYTYMPCHQNEYLVQKGKLDLFFSREVMTALSRSSPEMHFSTFQFQYILNIPFHKKKLGKNSAPRYSIY